MYNSGKKRQPQNTLTRPLIKYGIYPYNDVKKNKIVLYTLTGKDKALCKLRK